MAEFDPPQESPAVAALRAAAKEIFASLEADGPSNWVVHSGTWLSTNSNTTPWKVRARPGEDGSWSLEAVRGRIPWTRTRSTAIAEFRREQLASLLKTPRTLPPFEKDPFFAGPVPADRARGYAQGTALAAGSMLAVLFVTTLACAAILQTELNTLAGRRAVLLRVMEPSLPSAAEAAAFGFLDHMASALLMAAPIAFFLGLVHAAAHAAGRMFVTISQCAPWVSLFMLGSSLLMFLPRMAPALAIPLALAIPAAAAFGNGLTWGRIRDRVREGPPPARKFRPAWIGVALGVALMGALLTPSPRKEDDRIESTARFRDKFLLTNAQGRAFGRFYYRYTLYAAEPLKPVFAQHPDQKGIAPYDKMQRVVLVVGALAAEEIHLGEARFYIERAADLAAAEPLIDLAQHDLYVVPVGQSRVLQKLKDKGLLDRTLCVEGASQKAPEGLASIAIASKTDDWKKVLFRMFQFSLPQGMLVDSSALGWMSIFYAGPIFLLMMIGGLGAAIAVKILRTGSPRVGHVAIAGVFLVSTGILVAVYATRSGSMSRIAEIQEARTDDLKTLDVLERGLADGDAEVRYEASYQAFQKLKRTTFPRGRLLDSLLKTSGDPDVRVRLWSVASLGLTGDERARWPLYDALNDPELFVRYRAAEGLGNLDNEITRGGRTINRETIDVLLEVVKTRRWYEGNYAMMALRKMHPARY